MSTLQDEQKVTQDGRQNVLKDKKDEGLVVVADLREQIDSDLVKRLEKEEKGNKIVEVWHQANAGRVQYLRRQRTHLKEIDEFIEPIVDSHANWGSVLHIPTTLTICKSLHARMFSALTSVEPWFNVRARTGANVERAKLIEALMQYTLKDWSNEYRGIKQVLDDWLWDWITVGSGILKSRWQKKFTRFADVIDETRPEAFFDTDPNTGDRVQRVVEVAEPKIKIVTKEVFNGPVTEVVNIEDIVIIGGDGDPQKADYVIQQSWLTASELWSLADQKIFRKSVIKEIIEGGDDSTTADDTGTLKQERKEHAGLSEQDKTYDLDRYHILECYLEADVDGSGINSQIVVWIHRRTNRILRATYLWRVMATGQRPFFKIDFHRRRGSDWGVGMPELLHSLSKEIDAIHNMRIDVGILQSMPFGFYKPMSAMSSEKYEIEPGTLVPVENPQTDIAFPNMGNKVSFGFQEEASLNNIVQRLTSISDISLGSQATQGAGRTATGVQALQGETSVNLDIFIQRMGLGWKAFLKYTHSMLQQKLPPGFQFRVLGDSGDNYWAIVERREEIQGMFDFEIEANSINSNRQIMIQQADVAFQLTMNPIMLQLGIVNPLNVYNAAKNTLQVRGIKEITKFLTKPAEIVRVFTPMEIGDRILSGIDVQLDPTQDLQGFIDFVDDIEGNDEALGQHSPPEAAALFAKRQEAQQMLQAVQQVAAQQANIQQQQVNQQQALNGQTFEQTQPQTTGTEGAS